MNKDNRLPSGVQTKMDLMISRGRVMAEKAIGKTFTVRTRKATLQYSGSLVKGTVCRCEVEEVRRIGRVGYAEVIWRLWLRGSDGLVTGPFRVARVPQK
jgi:hypothetical protein